MPRRLVIAVASCVSCAAIVVGPALGDSGHVHLVGSVESPVHFQLPPRPVPLPLRAVELARQQLGTPYVWGGASPGGFDCSGLVSWVYGRLGITLPHNAAALYGTGRPVSLRALRPGDLVFFPGLGHVGLYIGRGQMIHAPETGRRVEVERLDMRSYPPVGARRIVRA